MPTYQKDTFIFVAPSKKRGKKYDVYTRNKKYITSFGAIGYQQYKDKIGYYKKGNHLDKTRRASYYARHGDARLHSAKWFSHRYLW